MRFTSLARFTLFAVSALVAVAAQAAREIPVEYRAGTVWLKVTARDGGQPLNFLLDSGAGASVLDLGTARRIGAKLGSAESVQGVGGRTTGYRVSGFEAKAGETTVPVSLLAIDLGGVSAALGRHIDGLLGADFFRGRIVQIDYRSGHVRLLDRGEVSAAGCEALPLARRGDSLCVRAGVGGNAAEWMRVDTGCSTALEWVMTDAKAKKLSGATIGATAGVSRQISADLQLGGIHLPGVKTGVHDRQIFAGEAGLLGNGVLSRFTVTFDCVGDRLLLAR